MKIQFLSVVDDEKSSFITDGIVTETKICFKDNSDSDTSIIVDLNENSIDLTRIGSISSKMTFIEGEFTDSFYHDSLGLELNLRIFCTKIIKEKNKINIEYDNYLDNSLISKHKIWIIIRNNA